MGRGREFNSLWDIDMEPELIIVDLTTRSGDLSNYLASKEYIAFDIETTGLTKKDKVIGFSICAELGKAFYFITRKGELEAGLRASVLLNVLSTKKLICHNGVFDCSMIENNYGIQLIESLHTDTMVLAHLLDENRKVGLKELARSMYGESSIKEQQEMKASIIANGGAATKANYELYKADPYLIGKYGAKDAWLTFRLFQDLVPKLFEQKLDKFFYEDESMPLLRGPTYELNTTGLNIDSNRLAKLKLELTKECEANKEFINNEIAMAIEEKYPSTNKKNTFNIESPSQLSWLVCDKYKLEFNDLTKEGKAICKFIGMNFPRKLAAKHKFINAVKNMHGEIYKSEEVVNGKIKRAKKVREPWHYIACDKKMLITHSNKHEWIKKLLEYKANMKLLNTYVAGIEKRVFYGVIYPSFLQHGTLTGRYASRNPNWQNLPREDQRIKECIVSRKGKVFVAADFSQLEPRIFSFYSQDEKLMSSFDGTSDFYSVVGQAVYNKYDCTPQKEGPNSFGEKYKNLRNLSKVIALASAYGATANQLAPTTGKSRKETQEDMEQYFKKFPGVRNMMYEAHNLVQRDGQVYNYFGRVRKLPEAKEIENTYGNIPHWDLPYSARKVLNQACNFRIQSTGASIINRAAIKFYSDCKELELNCKLVSQIHDELVVECNEEDAEKVSLLLQNAMENTNILEGVPLEAIPRISKTLAK